MTTYATGTKSSTSSSTNSSSSDLTTQTASKQDLSAVSDDIAALRADLAALAKHVASDAKHAATDQAEKIGNIACDAVESAKEHAVQMQEDVSDRIRRKPISSVLIAAAAGAVIAKVVLR